MLPPDLSGHARTLVEQFRLDDGVHQLRVRDGVAAGRHGRGRRSTSATSRGVTLVTVREAGEDRRAAPRRDRGRRHPARPRRRRGDRGAGRRARRSASATTPSRRESRPMLFNRASGLAEVMIPPRSPLIGERLFPGMVTPSGNLVVLAVQRHGAGPAPGEPLAAGDTCSCRAPGTRSTSTRAARGAGGQLARPRPPPGAADGPGALPTLAVLAVMVVCSRPAWCRRRSPGCSRPARCSSSASSRSRRSTARSTGRR